MVVSGHRSGPLCAYCEAGFSETYGSLACQDTSQCTDGKWFVPTLFVFGSVVALWLFYGDISSDGTASVLIYFYQMVTPACAALLLLLVRSHDSSHCRRQCFSLNKAYPTSHPPRFRVCSTSAWTLRREQAMQQASGREYSLCCG
jgi:hypothetical protein